MLRILALVYCAACFLCTNTPWCLLLIVMPILLRRREKGPTCEI
jgi:hypothetical protein